MLQGECDFKAEKAQNVLGLWVQLISKLSEGQGENDKIWWAVGGWWLYKTLEGVSCAWTPDNMPLGKMTHVLYRSLVSTEILLHDECHFNFTNSGDGNPGGASGKESHLLMQGAQEKQTQSLGWEDPLEREMATHSSILAWRISWTEEPGGLQSTGLQRVGHDWAGTGVRAKGMMSYAYFRIHCKGLGSLESKRTKFKSKLWYLAVRFWTDDFISFVAARPHHSYRIGAWSSKEVESTKGLSLGRKTPTHRWFIAI